MTGPRDRGGGRSRGRGRGRGRGYDQIRRSHQDGSRAAPSPAHKSHNSNQSNAFDDQEMNADLSERFRRGKNKGPLSHNSGWSAAGQSDLDVSLNLDIRKYIQEQHALKAEHQKEDWIERPELPGSSEISLSADASVNLPPNKINTKFKSIDRYLRTHYMLLREDAVGPLRDAVDRFCADPLMDDDANINIYEKVHICGFTFTDMGIAARLKFSTIRAGRKIMWSASKRLVSGSVVALTPAHDNFSTECIVAIIAARPLELLERSPPEVDIYFSCIEHMQIDPQISYVMVEAKQGYYEAHRYTLKALQKLSKECFPLAPHIIGSELDINAPSYLSEWSNRSLVAAIDNELESTESFSSVDIINDWPDTPTNTTLDHSQWNALEHILTKKLAIIQGPPGTGKTHISKVALEIMMQNRAQSDPPIIVAAQTNHALDQLLKHVSKFDPEYIRLGGRSTSVEIKKRALYEVRRRERIPPIPGGMFKPARKRIEREQAKYGDLLSILVEDQDLIPSEKLLQLGIINAEQHQSLQLAVNNWVTSDNTDRSPMQYWLHRTLIPFEVNYNDDTFGFEDLEEDLELEQLRETEAEHGVADEEDLEMLRGPWRAVADDWTVAPPSENELERAKNMLDTKDDLWDIPEHLRGAAYLIMKQKAKLLTLAKFKAEASIYQTIVEELKIGKWENDAVFLKRANIIGMTTTGLSKYRPLIASLRPKIVLIEEAAEVIEGPVTAACMESLEHLILIGDHQQLQGHCAVQDLESGPFHLNVSMFERLVNLNLPFKTLTSQRRMLPEIRQLISSLYPQLEDHESVLNRNRLPFWGTGNLRSFFFQHDWLELKDQAMSTYNEEEARMVAKFYRHLLRNHVPPAAISILTFYNGQRKRILRELRNDPETNRSYNNVKTVDSYQGEENEIIILSLVRNNFQGQLGFLDNDNRVCVALSRARNGFYLFGNSSLLSQKNEAWFGVETLMSGTNPVRLDTVMPLTCTNHNREITVQWPEDFDKTNGGCDLWCDTKLQCGHTCPLKCHPMSHDVLPCKESCGKVLSCGHTCTKQCHEFCHCDCVGFQSAFPSESRSYTHSSVQKETFVDQATDHSYADMSGRSTPDVFNPHDNSNRTMMRDQSGRVLARGGAAFQPILSTPRAGTRYSIPERNTNTTHEKIASRVDQQQNWASFASGGVREDDIAREESRLPKHIIEDVNLLDLSSGEELCGVVDTCSEQRLNNDRSKFVQTYRPEAPSGFGVTNSKHSNEVSAKNPGNGEIPNLMD